MSALPLIICTKPQYMMLLAGTVLSSVGGVLEWNIFAKVACIAGHCLHTASSFSLLFSLYALFNTYFGGTQETDFIMGSNQPVVTGLR